MTPAAARNIGEAAIKVRVVLILHQSLSARMGSSWLGSLWLLSAETPGAYPSVAVCFRGAAWAELIAKWRRLAFASGSSSWRAIGDNIREAISPYRPTTQRRDDEERAYDSPAEVSIHRVLLSLLIETGEGYLPACPQ